MVLAVLLSVLLVWKPWGGLALQPKGLKFGVDIAGGSRAILGIEVSHVTIETATEDLGAAWNTIRSALENSLNTSINLVAQYPVEHRMVVEIGKSVTRDFIQSIISGSGAVVEVKENSTQNTQSEAISKLQARIDPYGTLGTQFRALGDDNNYALLETTELDSHTKKLLETQGWLEIFIDNERVLTSTDIKSFYAPAAASAWYTGIPFHLTDDGAKKLEAAAKDKTDHPGVVYLDRPSDAILIFDEGILGELSELEYDNVTHTFRMKSTPPYTLQVPAVWTAKDNFSEHAREYLENNREEKLRVIILGNPAEFTGAIENIPPSYRRENIPQLSGEDEDKWVKRACGIISDLSIGLGVGEGRILAEVSLQEARDLRVILSNRSPAKTSVVSEAAIGPRLGAGFAGEILIAGTVAFAAVFLLVYHRYRRWKISLALVGITLCELAITLGAASVLGLTIGLPELGGLLIIIGIGIGHLLIATDEMLRGGVPKAEKVSVGWRISRTLAMVYALIFVVIAAMVPIALLGFGALRGLAIITIPGTILALLLTRPTYVRIIDAIMAGQ